MAAGVSRLSPSALISIVKVCTDAATPFCVFTKEITRDYERERESERESA